MKFREGLAGGVLGFLLASGFVNAWQYFHQPKAPMSVDLVVLPRGAWIGGYLKERDCNIAVEYDENGRQINVSVHYCKFEGNHQPRYFISPLWDPKRESVEPDGEKIRFGVSRPPE